MPRPLLPVLTALFIAICTVIAIGDARADGPTGKVYLEVLRSPPIRHVIAMDSKKNCLRAAKYSNARCVSRLPRLPDSSVGVFRSTAWSAKPFVNDKEPVLKGKDFGPVYLVVRRSPPNRHVIAMASMKKCLEAIAYSSAECLEKLPKLPDSSIGVLRTLNSSRL